MEVLNSYYKWNVDSVCQDPIVFHCVETGVNPTTPVILMQQLIDCWWIQSIQVLFPKFTLPYQEKLKFHNFVIVVNFYLPCHMWSTWYL